MTKQTILSLPKVLALALPTMVFAGYDLARRNYLAVYLTGDLKLSVATVGWLVVAVNLASIPAELLAGAFGDHGLRAYGRRQQWMVLGTLLIGASAIAMLILQQSLQPAAIGLALISLVVGWALCNVSHGAWTLEVTGDSAQRARVFGWRSVFGIVGSIGFSVIATLPVFAARSPFLVILLPVVVGACLTHALLIASVPDRSPVPGKWLPGLLFRPLQLLVANAPNRQLAALFALNGAHTAITATSFLYVVEFALALPEWGPKGVMVQSASAAVGVLLTIRLSARKSPADILRRTFWANLVLGLALIVIPPRTPAVLLLWSGIFGLFSMADFMALRMMLGDRLDFHASANSNSPAAAAAHYAGFHLPFNLSGALAGGLLFLGYRLFRFEPSTAHAPEQAFVPVILLPSLLGCGLMVASLWILAVFQRETALVAADPVGSDINLSNASAEQL